MLAKHDEYIGEAVAQLEVISQNEQMRMEYDARKKGLYDYNTLWDERYEDGQLDTLLRLLQKGILTLEQAAEDANMTAEEFCKETGYTNDAT